MKFTPLFVAASAATSALANNWGQAVTEKSVIKDKTIKCSSCVTDSMSNGITDMFNQMAGGKNTGTVKQGGDGFDIILNFKKTASGAVDKPESRESLDIALAIVPSKPHPAQGCFTLKHLSKPQVEFSYTINSKDHHFNGALPACGATGL